MFRAFLCPSHARQNAARGPFQLEAIAVGDGLTDPATQAKHAPCPSGDGALTAQPHEEQTGIKRVEDDYSNTKAA